MVSELKTDNTFDGDSGFCLKIGGQNIEMEVHHDIVLKIGYILPGTVYKHDDWHISVSPFLPV